MGPLGRVYSSDLRVRVEQTGLGTYPDVTVVCGELRFDPASPRTTVVNPTLVVEILSDSTEAWDRNAKYDHFRRIPSLMEYVLVSHRERLIEVFRRGEGAAWGRWEARQGAAAELKALGGHLEVDSVYEGVELHLG